MIHEPRLQLRPYEYPNLLKYRDAIRHAYWIHTEFNLAGDVQDWHTRLTPVEREVVRRTLLAIAQVEVAVKLFWSRVFDYLPKPEIAEVGMTFAESEVRHQNAYAHLLDVLGLDSDFARVMVESPVFRNRVQSLMDAQASLKQEGLQNFLQALILFSSIVEHISLFSQFLIIMSFNKHRAVLKGVSNIVEATSKEEQVHGMFGQHLVRIFREEMPELFDSTLTTRVLQACIRSYQAEMGLLEWIFEAGELEFLPKRVVENYVMHRYNTCLEAMGFTPLFLVDEELLREVSWFEDEILVTKENDFFNKRSITYSKKMASFTEDDLF